MMKKSAAWLVTAAVLAGALALFALMVDRLAASPPGPGRAPGFAASAYPVLLTAGPTPTPRSTPTPIRPDSCAPWPTQPPYSNEFTYTPYLVMVTVQQTSFWVQGPMGTIVAYPNPDSPLHPRLATQLARVVPTEMITFPLPPLPTQVPLYLPEQIIDLSPDLPDSDKYQTLVYTCAGKWVLYRAGPDQVKTQPRLYLEGDQVYTLTNPTTILGQPIPLFPPYPAVPTSELTPYP